MKPFDQDDITTSHPEESLCLASSNKSASNRNNSLKSTGPKTPRGKSFSRKNALKHGLYSKELSVSEEDQPEFQELQVSLEAQLDPATMVQKIAFDCFVACLWRSKLAMRLERRQFDRQLQNEQHDEEGGGSPPESVGIEGWYGQGLAHILAGIRVLERAQAEFGDLGYFREETKASLKRGFTENFLRLLEEWPTMTLDAIQSANFIAAHTERYGSKLHTPSETSNTPDDKVQLVRDPMQLREMVGKLLEERRNYLVELAAMMRQKTLEGARDSGSSAEVYCRLLADANRESRRALDWFLFLKERGL